VSMDLGLRREKVDFGGKKARTPGEAASGRGPLILIRGGQVMNLGFLTLLLSRMSIAEK
jgi:hypothetical protein